jgi:Domain of unknown function (DUF4394)
MRKRFIRHSTAALTVIATAALLAACGGSDDDDDGNNNNTPPPAAVGDTVALTASGKLMSFNRATPGTAVGTVSVRGLASGESLLGIDYRPADGQLYAVGSGGTVYTIEPGTGTATAKATLKAAAGDDNPFTALAGTDFGVDFNPAADRLRVVSNTGQNLRINVDTGDTITDGAIAPASGTAQVSAAAYTNSFAGTTGTQLFVLDASAGTLHLQDPPNNGTLGAGLPLGIAATSVNGFDIDARNNSGYAVVGAAGVATLVTVNLASGAAASVGVVAGGEAIKGLALQQPAAPSALGLTADNRLIAFDPKAPNTISSTVSITGLGAGETVVGIDFRPANGMLYALTSAAKLYTVNADSGAATPAATLAADPGDLTAPYAGLSGTLFSADFNPFADRLRVVSDSGQSLRINADSGLVTTDGDINRSGGVVPSISAAAYSNSFAGAPATTLFDLDAASDVLARQDPPNSGTLVDVGALGIDITGAAGFDIAGGGNGLALAALRAGGSTSGPFTLYTVSLTTGAATLYRNTSGDAALSVIGGAGGPGVIDLAIRF